jgi:hypothetical protein
LRASLIATAPGCSTSRAATSGVRLRAVCCSRCCRRTWIPSSPKRVAADSGTAGVPMFRTEGAAELPVLRRLVSRLRALSVSRMQVRAPSRSIAVLRIFIRTVMSFCRRRARKRGVRDGRTGSVTFLQGVGSAANCNLHFHVVMLDGVFAEDTHGELLFHAAEPPTEIELAKLIDAVRTRVLRIGADPDAPWAPRADRFKCSSKASTCTLGALSQRNTLRIARDSRHCCDTARDRSPMSACASMRTGTSSFS